MKKEQGENHCLREINFYGEEVAELLRQDVKLLTLRKPNTKYDLNIGETVEANCVDSGEKIRLVVIDNLKKPLQEYTRPELLLDGYTSVWEAEDDLKQYPGYENINEETLVQGIMTLSEETFLSLSAEEQAVLLHFGMDAALDVDQAFKELFFPAWCRWVIAKGGGAMEWRRFLEDNDLVYWDETTEEFDGMGPDQLLRIWEKRGSFMYRQLVLMEAGINY